MTTREPRTGNQAPKPRTDAALRGFGRFLSSIVFRKIEVLGTDKVPSSGPVIIVANHFNSLIDGMLVASYLPRFPRFLGASTIWDHRALRPFLKAAGVIPVFRHSDAGKKFARNHNSLAKAWELLGAGGVLALFPEGISHNKPYLLPAKTGAVRIALGAEQEYGPLGVTILPVGLVFDSKARFRSRVLIQIGEPIPVATDFNPTDTPARQASTKRASIKDTTQKVENGLLAVTQNFETWDDVRILGRAADIWAQQKPILPAKQSLADTFERRRFFGVGYTWMNAHHPEQTAAVKNTLTEYDALLRRAGLRDEQVAATYALPSVLTVAGRTAFALIIRLPLAVVGTFLNGIPFQVSKLFARGKDPDKIATWSLFAGLIMFPALWLVQAVVCTAIAALWLDLPSGWLVFATTLLAAPLSGPATLTSYDLLHRLKYEIRAWVILRSRKILVQRLRNKRRDVIDQLAGIEATYRKERDGS